MYNTVMDTKLFAGKAGKGNWKDKIYIFRNIKYRSLSEKRTINACTFKNGNFPHRNADFCNNHFVLLTNFNVIFITCVLTHIFFNLTFKIEKMLSLLQIDFKHNSRN